MQILGVNEQGHESGNPTITSGRDLPWLQETGGIDVWGSWGIRYRDVIIVDENNLVVEAYNLTDNDLADDGNYTALRDKLQAAAP